MPDLNELRLLVRVSRLYHEQEETQSAIAERLDLSQATVSRLLKRAKEERIVRTSVSVPSGAFPELEEQLQRGYGLKQAIVVDTIDEDAHILRDIGSAAAFYLEGTVRNGDVIGISSWSATLLAMVDVMHNLPQTTRADVVQILGGMGSPGAEVHATQLTQRLARLTNGEPVLLSAPGLAGSEDSRRALTHDNFVAATLRRFDAVTIALVGIGGVQPSQMLASSGNTMMPKEIEQLRRAGAAGDICLRFFDHDGHPVRTALDRRVIAMELEQLRRVRRSIGLAGGKRKLDAIHGALVGKWINVLITDRFTASRLVRKANVQG
jgi:DNA-binding transcriptional regulator LsrR (DeoR family)